VVGGAGMNAIDLANPAPSVLFSDNVVPVKK
jgi:hypothetical protein